MLRLLEALFTTRLLAIVTGAFGLILGIFIQPLLELRATPLFTRENIPLLMFGLIALVYALFIAIWAHTSKQITSIADNISVMAKYAGPRVQILSHVEGYKAVRKRTKAAQKEILKLVYYGLNFEDGSPIYDPKILNSPERQKTYEQERKKLERERQKTNFKYVEIIQIPYRRNLENILAYDELYKENCTYLAEFNRRESQFASLFVSEVVFPNTFIIIDRSFLYIAFETKNPETGRYQYPFLAVVIEDPDAEVVREMLRLFEQIKQTSTLY